MVIIIRLYPIIATCLAFLFLEVARAGRRKGKNWIIPAFLALVFIVTIVLWVSYGGYKNAEQWSKDWASRTFSHYIQIV